MRTPSKHADGRRLYVGVMSGTSLDGADAVLVDFEPTRGNPLQVLGHVHQSFPEGLRTELLALNTAGANELHRGALAGNELARCYARVIGELLRAAGVGAASVAAAGVHGQTVRHRPREFDGTGYTVQIGNAALLAELSGIDIVADFRSRDVAAGGQGAPLVPAFHRALFGRSRQEIVVLNLGGIANLTLLRANGSTQGFDTGPASALMDGWIARHRSLPYDDGGAWAASGRVDNALLGKMLSEPFFALPHPKSTGRDLFNLPWLDGLLQGHERAEDVQATLLELTARTVSEALQREAPHASELIVCGGGARNLALMGRLRQLLNLPLVASDDRGLPAEQVEATAFAWLAKACLERQPGNLESVTGAQGPRVLGAIYSR